MIYETFFIGLILAVLYVEVMEIYPGGIIVPAYLALYLDKPQRVLATLCIALLSLLAYRLISRWLILFGRRRFVLLLRGKSDTLDDCPGRRIDNDKFACLSGYRKESAVRG